LAREQRKLAAIVAADVVGYSRLMGRDESGTLARLRKNRSEHLEPVLAKYGGRLVKLTGDGVLIEFASAVDALSAAIEFQQATAEANRDQPPDTALVFRMGLHLGDLIVDGDDLYGDGVNIAARLEGQAEPGGIVVSGALHEAAAGKLQAQFVDLGRLTLRNIDRQVQAYRVELHQALQGPGTAAGAAEPLPLPDKPSIAVLPFQNMSGDPEQEYFADGVVDDIITGLSHFHSLFVIARNSSFAYKGRAVDLKQVGRELGVRYVLEGSVRKAAGQLRVTAQLIDATTGSHIWADRLEGTPEAVFEFQDQITEKVVAVIAPKVLEAEIARTKRKPSGNLDAYECYLRGIALLHHTFEPLTKQGIAEALRLFERAMELDPDYAVPYGAAIGCYDIRRAFGWVDAPEEDKKEVTRLLQPAVRVGRNDALMLADVAWCVAYVLHDLEAAKGYMDQALDLNANLARAWGYSGYINLWLGSPDAAVEHFHRALRHDPRSSVYTAGVREGIAHACFFLGRYVEAISWAEGGLRENPNSHTALRIGTASAAFAGRSDTAHRLAARLQAVDPAFRVSRLGKYLGPYQSDFVKKYTQGLRLAGLPE
jgi:TolB-like protein/class 3 adenylate cyclase/Tfp pilus assembly protein PilF